MELSLWGILLSYSVMNHVELNITILLKKFQDNVYCVVLHLRAEQQKNIVVIDVEGGIGNKNRQVVFQNQENQGIIIVEQRKMYVRHIDSE